MFSDNKQFMRNVDTYGTCILYMHGTMEQWDMAHWNVDTYGTCILYRYMALLNSGTWNIGTLIHMVHVYSIDTWHYGTVEHGTLER